MAGGASKAAPATPTGRGPTQAGGPSSSWGRARKGRDQTAWASGRGGKGKGGRERGGRKRGGRGEGEGGRGRGGGKGKGQGRARRSCPGWSRLLAVP